MAKNLARLDQRYDSLFNDALWKDSVGARSEPFSHVGKSPIINEYKYSGIFFTYLMPLKRVILPCG